MKKFLFVTFIALPMMLLTNCSSDDGNNNSPQEVSKTYQLGSVSDPSISGTAKFIKNSDNSTTVELSLSGTSDGDEHPAHIHVNTAAETGGIAVALTSVDGDSGMSTTTFSTFTYEEMIAFNGYINVHLSDTDLGTLVAQGDIGQNELTGTSTAYNLVELGGSGISGTAVFAERANGFTLVGISLTGTAAGTNHLAVINDGSVDVPGSLAISLSVVNGETGISLTSVSKKADETPISYQQLTQFDGHLNVNANETSLTVVTQGDIGINAIN